MRHRLKITSEHFNSIWIHKKTAEMRFNDRNFQIGDKIILREIDELNNFTGNRIYIDITHILTGAEYGIIDGYCMISFIDTLLIHNPSL